MLPPAQCGLHQGATSHLHQYNNIQKHSDKKISTNTNTQPPAQCGLKKTQRWKIQLQTYTNTQLHQVVTWQIHKHKKKWKYKKSGPGWSTLWCHLELPPQSPLTIILIHLNFISIIPWEICDHTLLPLLWWRPQYLRVTNRYFGEQLAEASEVNNGRQVAQKYEQQILLVEVTLVRAEVGWPWTDETKNVGSCLTGSAPVLVRLPLSALALRISWTECPGSYCMCVSACVCVAPWVLWTDTWLWAECFVCADLGPSVPVNRYMYMGQIPQDGNFGQNVVLFFKVEPSCD